MKNFSPIIFALIYFIAPTMIVAQVNKKGISMDKLDTVFVTLENKKVANGYVDYDIMVRGVQLQGRTGNYLSSLEVELEYNPRMFTENVANGTPTGGKVEASLGADFKQMTKVGKNWQPSYTVQLINSTKNRLRFSILMNYYPNASHFRGLLDVNKRAAIHVHMPIENCMEISSGLGFFKNGDITAATYVPSINAPFGNSVRFSRHVFMSGASSHDVSCSGDVAK